jgi:collagenase-like PrtC family protease
MKCFLSEYYMSKKQNRIDATNWCGLVAMTEKYKNEDSTTIDGVKLMNEYIWENQIQSP